MKDNHEKIKEEIDDLINKNELSQAISLLDRDIERHPDDATLWYIRGRVYWRLGNKGAAISDYEEATHLDAGSPAKLALEMARDIMDYYNPDLLNP